MSVSTTIVERLDEGIVASRFGEPKNPATSVAIPDFVPEQWARTRSQQRGPSRAELETELRRLQSGPSAVERARKLQVLLGQLEGLTFDEVAELLDQKPRRLADMVHGRIAVPNSLQRRLDDLGGIVFNVHEVLEPAAFRQWLRVDAPGLRGGSPLEAIKRGRIREVVALANSYRHQSFA